MYKHPFGFDERLPGDGVAPYAGAARPGPLGNASSSGAPLAQQESEAIDDAAASRAGAFFTLRSYTYRLRRVDTEWRQRLGEVLLPPEEAVATIEEAIVQHQRNRELVHLLQTAASRLAGVHSHGIFVLLRVRLQEDRGTVPGGQGAPVATPSALKPPSPADVPAVPDEPMMVDAQAVVLKNAAALGVPFCEECARAAAQRDAAPAA